ncbi:MAG: ATP-binding protein [Actinomycetaceae bacterium]|nr:ATP-binding protein [Actinomycetaceae bacterium]
MERAKLNEEQPTQVQELKNQVGRPQYDRNPVPGATINHLDPALIEQVVANAKEQSPRLRNLSDEQVLKAKGVLTQSGEVTVAGLYVLGNYPQEFLPSLKITAAVQLPLGGSERLRDPVDLDGPLSDMLVGAVDWIARNASTEIVYRPDGHAVDRPEFPLIGIREIISNALVHRSLEALTSSKNIEIRLTNELLVITNPGGLWGTTTDRLRHRGDKSAVNQVLYDLCKLITLPKGERIIEGEGGGIPEMLYRFETAGLPEPELVDTGVSFTAKLFRGRTRTGVAAPDTHREGTTLFPDEALANISNGLAIWEALAQAAGVADIVARTGLSQRQVTYALKKMQTAGIVSMQGGQGVRTTTYERAHS